MPPPTTTSRIGVLVLSSREEGPAWKAGLKGTSRDAYRRVVLGDIITAMNGSRIKDALDLYRFLDAAKVGSENCRWWLVVDVLAAYQELQSSVTV